MSDGSLSQDEIDALLEGSGDMDIDEPAQTQQQLSSQDIASFAKIMEGTLDSQGSNFTMLVNTSVTLNKPSVESVDQSGLLEDLPGELVKIDMGFSSGVPGEHLYLLDSEAALKIAGSMMGQDDVELDDAALNALQEAFSQVSGPVTTALGEQAGEEIMPEPPQATTVQKGNVRLDSGNLVRVAYPLTIEGEKPTQIVEVFDPQIVARVVGSSGGGQAQQPQQQQAAQQQPQQQQQDPFAGLGDMVAGGGGGGQMSGAGGGQGPNVQSVQFPSFNQGGGGQAEQGNIGLLMDVYMEMTVELGRTRKLIKEILGMGEGTIIELDKLAGEPVDILVNHKLIAKGEVVVIDENFGVRVTEIVSPMERVNSMS
jgi:flagellar motor switch protein FliN/FliY